VTELDVADLLARAGAAMRDRWPKAELADLQELPGGISSLTFAASLRGASADPRRVVVKVAPPGLEPVRNRDVLRQARVMTALHGRPGVLVPEVLAQDDGSPPFFVMEFVPGDAYEPKWDASASPPSPVVVERRARAAARMLARLQAIEPARVGLRDEPALSPAEELDRWARLFATAGDDLRAGEPALHDVLTAHIPAPFPARILHGDYRLGNMQFAGERLAAVIDWEIWSVGDPRADLAWLMAFAAPLQQRLAERDAANQAAADAMPDPAQLLEEFLGAAGAAARPADLDWFLACTYYKLGATMMVLAKRNRRLPDPDPGLELIASTTPAMLARGVELLG
jgi:aminoglycoside phosphotransferase (APT) family kinase protein